MHACACAVYCSYADSSGKTCKGTELSSSEKGLTHLNQCHDSCAEDEKCNFFSFHEEEEGLCRHFTYCEEFVDSPSASAVFMMNGE